MLCQAFFFFLKPVKTNEESGGEHYRSHTQSLLLVLTLQAAARELHFPPFLRLIRKYIHLSCPHPVHRSISCPPTYWEHVKSLHFSKKPKFSSLGVLCFLLSSIRRPLLCFKVSVRQIKDPRRRPLSPELIDGCTVLGNVGEV